MEECSTVVTSSTPNVEKGNHKLVAVSISRCSKNRQMIHSQNKKKEDWSTRDFRSVVFLGGRTDMNGQKVATGLKYVVATKIHMLSNIEF